MSTPMATSPLLELQDVSVQIGAVQVTKDLSICVHEHECWGILGPNGAGKTTLLKAMAGVHPIKSGQIQLRGQSMEDLSRRAIASVVGMLTQETRYAFEATCKQTVLVGRHPHLKPWARESAKDHEMADQALEQMGLIALAKRSCMDLSGGESRRLAMAALLVQDPSLFLLDEPTNHLDPSNQVGVLNVMGQRIRTKPKASVMALHEVNLATCYCTHCLMLFGNGQWLAGPTHDVLTTKNLSDLYQCRMRLVDDGEHKVFAIAG